MRLLLKITLAIIVLHGISLGAIISQQQWLLPHVQDILAIDEDCGNACWFGIEYGGQTHFTDVRTNLENYGITEDELYFRHSKMRFRVTEDNTESTLGSVEITIEEAYASTACFVPNQIPGKTITLADVITSFGSPDYFWVDLGSSRPLLRSNQTLIDYEMIFEEPDILIQGQIRIESLENRLPLDTVVELMCTPPVIFDNSNDFFSTVPEYIPEWQGFNTHIWDYAPSRVSVEDSPNSTQQPVPNQPR